VQPPHGDRRREGAREGHGRAQRSVMQGVFVCGVCDGMGRRGAVRAQCGQGWGKPVVAPRPTSVELHPIPHHISHKP